MRNYMLITAVAAASIAAAACTGPGNSGSIETAKMTSPSSGASGEAARKTQPIQETEDGTVSLEVRPVNLDNLSEPADLLGADGIELNYVGSDIIVFHSSAGLFVCEWKESNWILNKTVDLAPLEANGTQGDYFTMFRADGQEVLISPKCYAPDNENPVTYRYLISENRLELAGRFEEVEDSILRWSYSEEAMSIQESIRRKLSQKGMFVSNLYPVLPMDSEVYGFIAVDKGGLSSIQYGRYWKDSEKLEMEPIKRP